KAYDKLTAKAQNLDTSLKISEKALGVSESRAKQLESDIASSSGQGAALKQHIAELEASTKRLEDGLERTEGLLEDEREKRAGSEELLFQAKARIDELELKARELDETSAKLAALTAKEADTRARAESLARDVQALEATEQALLKEIDARD